jgi:hypothetical protein
MYGGAFGLSSAEDRKKFYAQIPQDIDVLISHGPPFDILDTAPISGLHEGFTSYCVRWRGYGQSFMSSVKSILPMASSKQSRRGDATSELVFPFDPFRH